jgi:hypothetical protein
MSQRRVASEGHRFGRANDSVPHAISIRISRSSRRVDLLGACEFCACAVARELDIGLCSPNRIGSYNRAEKRIRRHAIRLAIMMHIPR